MKDGKPELVSSEEFARICEFEGKLYLINTGHIVQYNGKELKKIAGLPRETPEITSATTIDNGVIMIGTPNMIYVFDCRTGKIAPAAPFFEGENIKSANSVIDQKGKAWFYNNTGIIWRQTAGNRFAKIELIPQHIIKTITNERFAVCCDSRGITWITTYGNGLFAFYPDSRIQHFTTKNSELSSDFLLSVMEDNSGEVWVGTESSGINKISLSNLPINIILPKPDGSKHVYDNAVRLIYENAAGQFWIGTRSGDLYLYDHDFNKLQTVNLKDDVPFKMLWRCCAAVNVLPVMKK
jgi:ligand-binding sensor domain-containing protein